jgi:molybdopterin-containing oxidoreductase family membrane subunit
MSIKFSTIEGRSRGYFLLRGFLILLSGVGGASFMASYIEGHRLLGGSNLIPWGLLIVISIYLIGLSAGALILSTLTYVFGKEEYKPISRMAVYLSLVLIFGAMVAIGLDLGRPEKSVRLFMFFVLNNMRSMFAINGILYGGYFVISLFYLGFIFADRPKMTKKIGILAIAWASLVHMGTGAIFGLIAARPIFHSPIKPFEFLAAAIVSGLALLLISIVFTFWFTGREVDKKSIFSLSQLLLTFIVILLVIVLVDKIIHLYSPEREPTFWLLTGPFAWVFWGLQVGCAYLSPIFILTHPNYRKSISWIVIASFFILIGIFGERFVLVIPGTAHPFPLFPGRIEGIWGETGIFYFTLAESLLALGLLGFMGFFYILGLKHLELLPVVEGAKPKK